MFNVKTMIKIWLTYRRLKVNLLEYDNPSRTENVDAVADMIPIQPIMLLHTNAHFITIVLCGDCDWRSISTILLIVKDKLLLVWIQGVCEARLCIVWLKLYMW